jgi:hypothetical protein
MIKINYLNTPSGLLLEAFRTATRSPKHNFDFSFYKNIYIIEYIYIIFFYESIFQEKSIYMIFTFPTQRLTSYS